MVMPCSCSNARQLDLGGIQESIQFAAFHSRVHLRRNYIMKSWLQLQVWSFQLWLTTALLVVSYGFLRRPHRRTPQHKHDRASIRVSEKNIMQKIYTLHISSNILTTKISKLQLRSIIEGKDPRLIPGPKASPSSPCLRIASWESLVIHGHSWSFMVIHSSIPSSKARNQARSKCTDQGHFSENGYLLRFSQGKAKLNNWKRSLKTFKDHRFKRFPNSNTGLPPGRPEQNLPLAYARYVCRSAKWDSLPMHLKWMKTLRYPSMTNEDSSLVFTPLNLAKRSDMSDCRSAWESPLTSRGWGLKWFKCQPNAMSCAVVGVKWSQRSTITDPSPHTAIHCLKTGLSLLVNLIQLAWRCRQPVEFHRLETWSWRNIG